jgi:plastocyanin
LPAARLVSLDVLRVAISLALVASVACGGPSYFGHAPGEDWGVSIRDGDPFFPTSVDVGVGSTVNWTNYGIAAQVLRSGTPAHPTPLISASIPPKHSFRYTFTQTGTFEFFLQDHPDIQGRVTIR